MEIFGFTPIDTAISVWAFEFVQVTIDLLFKKTWIGSCVFLAGFFIVLLKIPQEGRFKQGILLAVAAFGCIFLLIKPSFTPTSIRSFQQSAQMAAMDLKPMPLVLVTMDYWSNHIIASLIQLSSLSIPDELKYLNHPFKLHLNILNSQKRIEAGIEHISLQQHLRDFIEDEFWSALAKSNQRNLLPFDSNIIAGYSIKGKEHWVNINHDIDLFINNDQQWQETMGMFNLLNNQPEYPYQEQIKNAYIRRVIQPSRIDTITPISHMIYSTWFACIGGINAQMWLSFIPIVMMVIITMKWQWLLCWLKCFCWAKGLWLIGFLVYGGSFIFLKGQDNLLSTTSIVYGSFMLPLLAGISAWVFMRLK